MPEERLKLNRERNRDHSRRSRERKKALVEGLKKQVGAFIPVVAAGRPTGRGGRGGARALSTVE